MRHRKKFNHLGRKAGHRRALLANMASSLILHKRIKTTTAKAKALRVYIEPLITKTKGLSTIEEKTHAQRVVFSHLQDKYAVKELFGDVATKVESRPGGYTRILKLGNRTGDNADMSMIELVDYNENMLPTKEAKKTTRRSRRGGKKKSDETTQVTETTAQPSKSTDGAESESEKQSQVTDAEVLDSPDQPETSTETEKQKAPDTEKSTEEEIPAPESEAPKEEKAQASQEEDKKEQDSGADNAEEDNKEDDKSKE